METAANIGWHDESLGWKRLGELYQLQLREAARFQDTVARRNWHRLDNVSFDSRKWPVLGWPELELCGEKSTFICRDIGRIK